MNKINGVKGKASASTSLYSNEQTSSTLQKQTSGFPSFLRWFKRTDARKSNQHINCAQSTIDSRLSTVSKLNGICYSSETLSPPSSPNYLSPSSSCDSFLSTSTTGFAFISPSHYKSYGISNEPDTFIAPGSVTETYRRRYREHLKSKENDKNLTLRKKYKLYNSDIINLDSQEPLDTSGYDNIQFSGGTLPNVKNKSEVSINCSSPRVNKTRHRRTVSDSAKDKKSGAYLHVKGKRKAPAPPPNNLYKNNSNNIEDWYKYRSSDKRLNGTLKSNSNSTLGRKKRRAPQPPSPRLGRADLGPNSVLSGGLFDDKDIRAIIEKTTNTHTSIYSDKMKGISIESPEDETASRFSANPRQSFFGKLGKSQGDAVIQDQIQNPLLSPPQTTDGNQSDSSNKTTAPISPRPWYKRPISSHRDSAISFKREIALKTMEKRKSKCKDIDKDGKKENQLPELGYSRSSIFDTGHKFNFFMRGKDHSDDHKNKDKEKRKSGIGIPNISELDREAAAIVNKEHANVMAMQQAQNEKFYNPPEHLILQQQMFGSKQNIDTVEELDSGNERPKSTKDLISKFEATSNIGRITLNTYFIGRTDHFVNNKAGQDKIPLENTKLEDISSNEDKSKIKDSPNLQNTRKMINENGNSNEREKTGDDSNNITKMSWTCPFCTLENPYWRIICEVCERIKPYDKKITGHAENPKKPLFSPQVLSKSGAITNHLNQMASKLPSNLNNSKQSAEVENLDTKLNESAELQRKTELVKKYFMPKEPKKSSSDPSVGKIQKINRKSPSPSRLPISSPKLSRNRISTQNSEKSEDNPNLLLSNNINPEEKETNLHSPGIRKPLLDSSAIVTTVTPVFFATTVIKTPDVFYAKDKEIRPNSSDFIDVVEVRNARLAKFATPEALEERKKSISGNYELIEVGDFHARQTERIKGRHEDDYDSLEREKGRLREMIRAMNEKALAEKYPVIQKSSSKELDETVRPIDRSSTNQETSPKDQEATRLGAIKKVFTKNRSPDMGKNSTPPPQKKERTKRASPAPPARPKKVSSSAQTSALVKKSEGDKIYNVACISGNYELIEAGDFRDRQTKRINKSVYANCPIYENKEFGVNGNGCDYENQEYGKFSDTDKAKVKEISQQLTSVEGINDFKATLKNPTKGMSRTDTLALGKIMRNLECAIAEGNDELAAKIAIDLAKMKVSLHVTKQKHRPVSHDELEVNQNIIVDMYVEDRVSHKGPIQITITPLLTVLQLKQKIYKYFDVPIGVQRWLINDELADDDRTLMYYGVKNSHSLFHLFLVSNEQKKPEPVLKSILKNPAPSKAIPEDDDLGDDSDCSSNCQNDTQSEDCYGALALPVDAPKKPLETKENNWICPLCTLINPGERFGCIACSKAKPALGDYNVSHFIKTEPSKFDMPEELKKFLADDSGVKLRPAEKNDLSKSNANRKSSDVFNIIANGQETQDPNPAKTNAMETPILASNFSSPNITKIKYRGVDNFNPKIVDKDVGVDSKIEIPKKIDETLSLANAPPGSSHYMELLNLDYADVVPNVEVFDCPVCFSTIEVGQGAILRDCLHMFCKECLVHTVQYSEEAEVLCPFMDTIYSCGSVLQEREIKALVPKEIYDMHLAKSVSVAEHKIENTFHCKTPNCRGWCIYEDNVNQFKCPVCRITNCLTCRVVHDGLTCKQYQDRLNSDCDSNIEARRTKDMLKQMVEKGEAMNCPTCQVIMMKKWGCDWLKCSMCKTEVCWVTRGPRWGPGGKGDTSGGCKCGVDGKKCHLKCNYCH